MPTNPAELDDDVLKTGEASLKLIGALLYHHKSEDRGRHVFRDKTNSGRRRRQNMLFGIFSLLLCRFCVVIGSSGGNIRAVLAKHLRVLIYNGDADDCVPYHGNEEWTTSLASKGLLVEKSAWHPWFNVLN